MKRTSLHYLLIEDNPGDIKLMREAMKEKKSRNKLHVVNSGEDGLDFIHKRGPYRDAVTPDIILLDLNLPHMRGLEVLKSIRSEDQFKHIPIIITSTSDHPEDVKNCYRACANGYIVKPVDVDKFFKVIHALEELWLDVMELPVR